MSDTKRRSQDRIVRITVRGIGAEIFLSHVSSPGIERRREELNRCTQDWEAQNFFINSKTAFAPCSQDSPTFKCIIALVSRGRERITILPTQVSCPGIGGASSCCMGGEFLFINAVIREGEWNGRQPKQRERDYPADDEERGDDGRS